MSRRTVLLILVAGVALAVGGGVVAARWKAVSRTAPTPARAVPVVAEPKALDIGEVWETDRFAWAVPLTNSGPQAVTLTDLRGSCDCGTVEPSTLTLPPSGTQTVRLVLDLRSQSCQVTAAPIREFSTSLRATAKAGDEAAVPMSWLIHGKVKRPLQVSAVVFGKCSDLARPLPPLTVPIESQMVLENLRVESGTPDFRAVVRPVFGNSTRYELVVTPLPSLGRGTYSGSLTLTPVAVGGATLPIVRVPVSAEVVPDIEATPERVLVGARDTRTEVTEVVCLRSLSGRSFVVEQVLAE